jgi:DNA-binding response OmpR family regulator
MPGEKTLTTALVVEDNDAWAGFIEDELRDAELQPLRARTIEEARQLFRERSDILLVVLDVLFGRALEPRGIELRVNTIFS